MNKLLLTALPLPYNVIIVEDPPRAVFIDVVPVGNVTADEINVP